MDHVSIRQGWQCWAPPPARSGSPSAIAATDAPARALSCPTRLTMEVITFRRVYCATLHGASREHGFMGSRVRHVLYLGGRSGPRVVLGTCATATGRVTEPARRLFGPLCPPNKKDSANSPLILGVGPRYNIIIINNKERWYLL